MKKPDDYGNNKGNGKHLELGGHRGYLRNVEERISKARNEMLVVNFDFDDADSQPNYFAKKYDADDRPNKKWQGTIYIVPSNKFGLSMLEGLCTAVERSNPGFTCWADNGILKTEELTMKKVGIVVREEEYGKHDGSVGVTRKPFRFCTYEHAYEQEIPQKKKLRASEGFVQVDDFSEDGLPFG